MVMNLSPEGCNGHEQEQKNTETEHSGYEAEHVTNVGSNVVNDNMNHAENQHGIDR